MKATICTSTALVLVFAGVLPAADPGLVNLVMADAKVIAGANVAQAKSTPFGQYVLTLIAPHDQQLQTMAAMTGFDPRQDVNEIMVATNGGPHSEAGLVMARGTFNVTAITNTATTHGGITETYNGVIVAESPDGKNGFAFLDSTLAVAGDIASVKAAIDRGSSSQHVSQAVASQINQLSAANDAWVFTTVPPSSLAPAKPTTTTVDGMNLQSLQQIQQASAGVKLGASVTVTANAQTDTVQNATTLAGMLQLMANMAQMQTQAPPEAIELAKSVKISSSGNVVTVSFSMPQTQIQQLIDSQQRGRKLPERIERKK